MSPAVRGSCEKPPVPNISSKNQRDTVLIVTEGAKTEPHYYNAVRQELRLPKELIRIVHGPTDPKGIVELAISYFREDPQYDHVFCVFDRDTHQSYGQAITLAEATVLRRKGQNSVRITVVNSVPCFEYWYLLHYIRTTRQFPGTGPGGTSPGDQVESVLKQYWPGYTKGCKTSWDTTKNLYTTARNNALYVNEHSQILGTYDPMTFAFLPADMLMKIGSTQGC